MLRQLITQRSLFTFHPLLEIRRAEPIAWYLWWTLHQLRDAVRIGL